MTSANKKLKRSDIEQIAIHICARFIWRSANRIWHAEITGLRAIKDPSTRQRSLVEEGRKGLVWQPIRKQIATVCNRTSMPPKVAQRHTDQRLMRTLEINGNPRDRTRFYLD